MFNFQGNLDVSKSWMNRALIIQSFEKSISIKGVSDSDDVRFLKKALDDMFAGKTEFDAGYGGTTFRFLAIRLSREVGHFFIRADQRLLERPQTELVNILQQLGVQSELSTEGLHIRSNGWIEPKYPLKISTNESSQFLSSVLLNSINLKFDLMISIQDEIISEDYFKYTLDLLETCGIKVIHYENSIFFKKEQKLSVQNLQGELDVSSAFALIAAGILKGDVTIENWNSKSLQPDMNFLNILNNMKITYIILENKFQIKSQMNIESVQVHLGKCPDLFPILSVLCAFANGKSSLFGAPQLKHKESDRILKTTELLTQCGFSCEGIDDGIRIIGNPDYKINSDEIIFNPDHDHRMAMAATLLKLKGFPIKILEPLVINKSYPQFYQHIGLKL